MLQESMGGGDDKQERKTAAIAVGSCVKVCRAPTDKNIQVLNDGSVKTFSTSFLLISYT